MTFNVGFVGLGKMGLPMAKHLAAAGHRVTVYDLSPERRALAELAGLQLAPSLPSLLSAATLIVSSIPNDSALSQVVAEVCQHAKPESLYVDTSTVSLQASSRAALALTASSIRYLRCTVSGNNVMAEAAKLTSLVSGMREDFEQVKPMLDCWGPTAFYLGTGEEARLMKLVLNLMIMLTTGMLAEGLALGRKGGLAWQDMWTVLGASAISSPILKAKADALSRRDFTPTFTVEQMQKDMGLILDAGQALQVPLNLSALSAQWLSSAAAHGDGQEDYAAVIKVVEAAAAIHTNHSLEGSRP